MPRTKKPNTKDKAQHTVPPEEQLTAVTGNTDATIAAPEQEAPAVTAKADAADAAPAAVAEKEETAEAAVNAAAEAAAENIIPFAPIIRSSDVFNAPYTKEQWLAAGLPERKFEQFHELQTEVLAKVENDPDVLNLLDALNLKPKDFIEAQNGQEHDLSLLCYDMATAAFFALW